MNHDSDFSRDIRTMYCGNKYKALSFEKTLLFCLIDAKTETKVVLNC